MVLVVPHGLLSFRLLKNACLVGHNFRIYLFPCCCCRRVDRWGLTLCVSLSLSASVSVPPLFLWCVFVWLFASLLCLSHGLRMMKHAAAAAAVYPRQSSNGFGCATVSVEEEGKQIRWPNGVCTHDAARHSKWQRRLSVTSFLVTERRTGRAPMEGDSVWNVLFNDLYRSVYACVIHMP